MRSVVFAHGLSGSPNGTKATILKEHFNTAAPSLGHLELPEQVDALQEAVSATEGCLLVGSSLGALAALGVVQREPCGVDALLLLAPAFDLVDHEGTFAEALQTRPDLMKDAPMFARMRPPEGLPCHVVCGMEDELFEIDSAVAFAREVQRATLTLVHDNHQLERWTPGLADFIRTI